MSFQPTFRFIPMRHVHGYQEREGKSCVKCKRELDPEHWFHRANSLCSPKGKQYCYRSTKTALKEVSNAHR